MTIEYGVIIDTEKQVLGEKPSCDIFQHKFHINQLGIDLTPLN